MDSPTFMTHVAMLGWFPVCMTLFSILGGARAALLGLVIGLFALPNATYVFAGIPDYDKSMAIGFGVLVAALLFDSQRLLAWRPAAVDLPIALYCVAPFLSAIQSGTGTWWGLSESFGAFVSWGVPWILGRVYASTPSGMRYLGVVLVGAALVYLPLCAWEIRMSPRLHEMVYGLKMKSFRHASRSFGWRPYVFMSHGLMAAMVLSMSALVAYWLWSTRTVREIWHIPMGWVCLALTTLTLATQSANAALMLAVGVTTLWVASRMKTAFPMLLLGLIPPVYIGLRYVAEWNGDELVEVARKVFGERRATSLEFRLDSETMMRDRSKLRPWFGFSAISDMKAGLPENAKAVTDSMWLIIVGIWGATGLAGAFGTLFLGPFLLWKKLPVHAWRHPVFAPLVVFGAVLALYASDCLLNAYSNPVFLAAVGGIGTALGTRGGRAAWGLQ